MANQLNRLTMQLNTVFSIVNLKKLSEEKHSGIFFDE